MSGNLHPDDAPSDNDTDSDVEVEYGVRRSRRRTNFLCRDSSSLYLVQFIDIEVYLAAAQFALSTTTHLLPILSFFITLYNVKMSAYRAWERTTRQVAVMGAMLREDLIYISSSLTELHFLLSWIGACGELPLLYVDDLTYYV